MLWRKMTVLAAFLVVLAACTRYPPEIYGFEFDHHYVLDAGDEVRVVVYEVDNLPLTFKVDASGHISMPTGRLRSRPCSNSRVPSPRG